MVGAVKLSLCTRCSGTCEFLDLKLKDVATKYDIKDMATKQDIAELRKALEAKIEREINRLEREIDGLEKEIDRLFKLVLVSVLGILISITTTILVRILLP